MDNEQRSGKRMSLSKKVADKLEEMITSGQYKLGQKINTETELMEMFQVSRNTLREAIKSLSSAGILEVRQGDGTYVRSTNRFAANMSKEYEKATRDDVDEVRNALEITIARLAATRRNEFDLEAIYIALCNRQQQKADIRATSKADMNFHLAIAEASHNRILRDLYISITSYLENTISEKIEETTMNVEEIDNLHKDLYLAIKDGDRTKAIATVHAILAI